MENRNLIIQVRVDDEHYRAVLDDIKRYRAVCWQTASQICTAEAAISRNAMNKEGRFHVVPPKPYEGATVLEQVISDHRKGKLSGLRAHIVSQFPEWKSDVADACMRDVEARLSAPDPKLVKAKRRYLIHNQMRTAPYFQRMGLPVRTRGEIHFGNRKLALEWNYARGPIEFEFGRLEGYRLHVLAKLESGEWKIGDPIRILESDGILKLILPYSRPSVVSDGLNAEAELKVVATPYGLQVGGELWPWAGEVKWLSGLKRWSESVENARASHGDPQRRHGQWKAKEAWTKQLERITLKRTRGCETTNHVWTTRILHRALRGECGVISVLDLSGMTIGSHSWPWSQFMQFLEYKCGEKRIAMKKLKITGDCNSQVAGSDTAKCG